MRGLPTFARDDTGAVTIEFVTLVPAFIFMMVLFTDASIIYLTRTEMWNTARDVTRRMSTEQITTVDAARSYANAHLLLGDRAYDVVPTFGAELSVTINVGLRDAAIFGSWIKPIIGDTITVRTAMRKEPLL